MPSARSQHGIITKERAMQCKRIIVFTCPLCFLHVTLNAHIFHLLSIKANCPLTNPDKSWLPHYHIFLIALHLGIAVSEIILHRLNRRTQPASYSFIIIFIFCKFTWDFSHSTNCSMPEFLYCTRIISALH